MRASTPSTCCSHSWSLNGSSGITVVRLITVNWTVSRRLTDCVSRKSNLKTNRCEYVSWLENVENMETFSFSGFAWLFCPYLFSRNSLLRRTWAFWDAAMSVRSLPMKSKKQTNKQKNTNQSWLMTSNYRSHTFGKYATIPSVVKEKTILPLSYSGPFHERALHSEESQQLSVEAGWLGLWRSIFARRFRSDQRHLCQRTSLLQKKTKTTTTKKKQQLKPGAVPTNVNTSRVDKTTGLAVGHQRQPSEESVSVSASP